MKTDTEPEPTRPIGALTARIRAQQQGVTKETLLAAVRDGTATLVTCPMTDADRVADLEMQLLTAQHDVIEAIAKWLDDGAAEAERHEARSTAETAHTRATRERFLAHILRSQARDIRERRWDR